MIGLGDTLFSINPTDGSGDCIYFEYDVGAGMLAIIMRFTRVAVVNVADPTAVGMLNKIKYSIDHLFKNEGEVQLEIGTPLELKKSIY